MEINWLTIGAQVVNFLILVWLLKHFLYGPIISAMDGREARIAERMREADEKSETADESAREYRRRLQELEQRQDEIMRAASSEAADERERLLTRARQEVEQAEQRWHHALADEKQTFLRELRRRGAEQVCAVARRALADLADVELERQVAARFLRRVRELEAEERERLAAAIAEAGEKVMVASAFELSAETREELILTVQRQMGAAAGLEFTIVPTIMCGIELRAGGHKLAWSLESYLSSLEEELAEMVAREVEEEP